MDAEARPRDRAPPEVVLAAPGSARAGRVAETRVKARGEWSHLHRTVDKGGATLELHLSPRRYAKAARRFLGRALRG
jgi:transposase-like protein